MGPEKIGGVEGAAGRVGSAATAPAAAQGAVPATPPAGWPVESKLAKRAYELLSARVKELFHGVSLVREGRAWSALEGVQLLELAQWREFDGYVWRIYKAGLLLPVAGGKAVAVYALKYVREEGSGSEEHFFAVARERAQVGVRERSRWREEVWRGAWREAELVERESVREVEVPVSPELVEELLSLLNPLLGAGGGG